MLLPSNPCSQCRLPNSLQTRHPVCPHSGFLQEPVRCPAKTPQLQVSALRSFLRHYCQASCLASPLTKLANARTQSCAAPLAGCPRPPYRSGSGHIADNGRHWCVEFHTAGAPSHGCSPRIGYRAPVGPGHFSNIQLVWWRQRASTYCGRRLDLIGPARQRPARDKRSGAGVLSRRPSPGAGRHARIGQCPWGFH